MTIRSRLQRLENQAADRDRPTLAQRLAAARARFERGEPSRLPTPEALEARGDALGHRLARALRRTAQPDASRGATC